MANNRGERDKKKRLGQRNNGPAPQGSALPLSISLESPPSKDTKSDISGKEDQSKKQSWKVRELLARSRKILITVVGLIGIGGVSWLLSGVDIFYQSKQAKFAGEQVGISREQLEISKQSMVLPNRPKFALQPHPRPPLVAGQPIRIETVWKNVGHSDALNAAPCAYHAVALLPDESFVAPPCSEAERKKLMPITQHVPIVPNNMVTIPFVVTLTEQELRQIREKKAALYLYGEMPYRDFAKNTYPLSFCFFLTGEENGSFGVCPKGNVNE